MLILPAIDLIGGSCVRLTQGDYDRKTDYGLDPLDVAKRFADEGAEWLHMVDLDGAKVGHPVNLAVLERIARETPLKVEFGGGIRDAGAADAAFAAGATRVVVGTALVRDEAFARDLFDRRGEGVVAGIDTREGKVAVHGWQEGGEVDGLELARRLVGMGCRRIITTDIATDGAFTGPNVAWLRAMAAAVPVPVIASGGIATVEDLSLLRRELPQIEGVIVGKAIYEGRFTVAEAVATLGAPAQP
jgi:phosphoribosylformimino-5-aminoimidazole carboxamide ribotide isomerase